MRTRATLTTAAALAIGALLGWRAASGQLNFNHHANAAPQAASHPKLVAKADPKKEGQPAKDGMKPNILVIFGDDIGIPQISAYTQGLMGYRTPNIDRIAKEGALLTDSYGQQSCTAGSASFILGQEPFRTGLLTNGMPGDPHGITD